LNFHSYMENGDCHLLLSFGIFEHRHLQNGSSWIADCGVCPSRLPRVKDSTAFASVLWP
jgi:hypothetical protein